VYRLAVFPNFGTPQWGQFKFSDSAVSFAAKSVLGRTPPETKKGKDEGNGDFVTARINID